MTTRRSKRIAAADARLQTGEETLGPGSDRISKATVEALATKAQRNHQAKVSQNGEASIASQLADKEILPANRSSLPRKARGVSKTPTEGASFASQDARNGASNIPQLSSEVQHRAKPVPEPARGTKRKSPGDEDDVLSSVASKRARSYGANPVPQENLDARDQALSEDEASVPPAEDASETGNSGVTKRRSHDDDDGASSPGSGEENRRCTGRSSPRANAGDSSQARSEDSDHESPPPEQSLEQRFYDSLLYAVITHRTLRTRKKQHKECVRLSKQAQLVVSTNQGVLRSHNPNTDLNWATNRTFRETLAEWEPELQKRQDREANVGHEIEFLNRRIEVRINRLQSFSHVSREDDALEFLAQNNNFWENFMTVKRHRAMRIVVMDLRRPVKLWRPLTTRKRGFADKNRT